MRPSLGFSYRHTASLCVKASLPPLLGGCPLRVRRALGWRRFFGTFLAGPALPPVLNLQFPVAVRTPGNLGVWTPCGPPCALITWQLEALTSAPLLIDHFGVVQVCDPSSLSYYAIRFWKL